MAAYGQRPIEYPEGVFADVNWAPVVGTSARTDLTRPYSTYSATCDDVKLAYPVTYPPLSRTSDRACVLTPSPGKVYRGGLDAYTRNQAQNGLLHKLKGAAGFTVSHVESLPSWADIMYELCHHHHEFIHASHSILANLGIATLANTFQATTKATSLHLPFNSIKDLSTTQFPVQLATLSVHHNKVVSFNTLSAPGLKYLDLSFNNMSSLKTTVFPDSLRQLNLANNRINELKANFPSTLRFLYLGGNPITAFYANESQFDILASLQNPQKATAASCGEAEVYPGDCSIVLDTTATNSTCTGHTSVRLLWNTFPICIVPDDPRSFKSGKNEYNWSKFWNTTAAPPTGPDGMLPWKGGGGHGNQGGEGSTSSMLVGGVLVGVVVILGAYYAYRQFQQRQACQWYNEVVTKGNKQFVDSDNAATTDQCEIHHDIRHDPSFAVFRIPATNIERGAVVARGGYGIVYIATLRTVGKPPTQVAMKQMLPEKGHNVDAIEAFMDEIRVSARLYHPKIVSFIGMSWTNLMNLSMINEYMGGGDLWSFLEVNRTQRRVDWNVRGTFRVDLGRSWLSSTTASAAANKALLHAGLNDPNVPFSKFSVLLDMSQALQYLHSPDINIIHRDLKAKNVLLGGDRGVAKLADFGTSRETMEDQTMTAEIGTVPWIAPEVLMGVRYTKKADIYSFGVLMSEIDLCIVPYSDLKMIVPSAGVSVAMANARISMMVVSGELRPSFSKNCPQAMIEIAQRCLAFDPADRPSADELVSWFTQFLE
ncbi:hypothetical protein DYB31_008687 [Aphanomyces astaci]|uniref:Protein kinase domain-containing protein n=1 Tax=Aphanomyces astaci TaxID=112090 RepID=A0A397FDZ9_APHAT|nr:hypothetical protein DYB31_008687 [Aphanomyces astaci]